MPQTSGFSFPQHIIIKTDNAVAQAKNQFVFLAWLVSERKCFSCNIVFSHVGRTHEAAFSNVYVVSTVGAPLLTPNHLSDSNDAAGQDIDQLFGLVLSLI